MKSIKLFNVLLIGILLVFTSCEKYLDVNTDPNKSTTSRSDLQLSVAQLYIGNAMGDRMFSQCNVWCQYNTGGPGVSIGLFDQNSMNSSDANQVFRDLYRSSSNLSILKKDNSAYKAVGQILAAYNASVCADLFGDIPYVNALKGDIDDGSILNPTYDNAQNAVYPELEKSLLSAITLLNNANSAETISGDLMYAGDLAKWKKFANSLLLKLYVRQGDSGKAKLAALGVAAGQFIESNEDNAKIAYIGGSTGSNPFWQDAKSTALGNFYVASETAINYLSGSQDPRIDYFYNFAEGTTHKGLKQGDVQNAPSTAKFSRPNGALLKDGGLIFNPKSPVILMTSWEVNLLLAEANARGWIGGDAKTYYENGVHLNCEYLGVDTTATKNYLAGKGAFDAANPLKSISLQKWACMNNLQPIESWIETRRTDSPSNPLYHSAGGIFVVPTSNILGGNNFPTILYYPESEQSLNKNFPGQHNLTDKVFWDN